MSDHPQSAHADSAERHPSMPRARASRLLAIETSTSVARVEVVDANTGERLGAAQATSERHSANLLRLAVETLEQAGASLGDLAGIACGRGPGSFTGLRVGLAVAKGLALPTQIPLILVSSLEALAMDMRTEVAPGEVLLPCIDAGKGQIFAAVFEHTDRLTAQSEDWSVTPQTLVDLLGGRSVAYAGPGAVRYRDVLGAGFGAHGRYLDVPGPSASSVAARALERLRRGESDDLAAAVPTYGRPPDITRPRRSGP